jgi:cytochrome c556
MRKVSMLIGICMLAAVVLLAQTADLDPVMKEVGPANQQLGAAITGNALADVATHATKLEGLFRQTESFMKAKGASKGQAIAAEAAASASEAAKQAKAGNLDAAKAAAGKIKGTCKGCHEVHREQLPDKTYKFKAGT